MALPSAMTVPSGEALRSIFAASPDGIVVADPDGVVLYANPAAMRMARPEGAALVGTRFEPRTAEAVSVEVTLPETGTVVEMRVSRLRWDDRPARLMLLHEPMARRPGPEADGRPGPEADRRPGSEADRRELAEMLDQSERVARLGNFWIDLRAGRLICTPGFARALGRTIDPQELLLRPGRIAAEAIHPDDRERVAEAYSAAVSAGAPADLEFRTVRPEGEQRVVRLVIEPVTEGEGEGEGGPAIGLRGTLKDITERRSAEESERRVHRLFQAIADNTPASIYVKDAAGRHVFANAMTERLFGRSREQLASMTLSELVDRESAEVMMAQDSEVLATGTVLTIEETVETARGGEADWLTLKFPIPDEEGRPYAVGGVSIDITEQRRAREALRRSEERFRLLAESSEDMVFLARLAPERSIEYVTPAARTVLGFAPEELIGEFDTVFERLHPDDRATVENLRPSFGPELVRMHRADGSLVWVEMRLTPITDDTGQVVAVQGNVRDVTRRVEAEQERERLVRQLEQAERLETLGRLAGGVAHDVNNLLAVILGTAELLSDDLDSGRADPADVERISQTAQRGAALTRQLLIFSRREPSSLEHLDVTEVVGHIEELLRRTIGEDVEFVTRLSQGLKAVNADRSKLEQVVLNLVVNARAAMPEGGRLTVRTDEVTLVRELASPSGAERPVPPGEYVRLTVADTGEGMTPEVARRAFEPFFSTREKGHGSGLGLSTVHGVVTEVGGHIRLDSRPGAGTAVEVFLPACSEPAASVRSPEREPPAGRGETVLVVEDEEPVREVVTRILSRGNYQVLMARDAAEALRICHDPETKIDLLLTDVIMPGMSGFQLGDRLRAVRPGVPVVYMSGYAEGQRPPDGQAEGAAAVLHKPFEAGSVLRRVREALDAEGGGADSAGGAT